MNKLLFIIAVIVLGFFAYQEFVGKKLEPLYEKPYVILYGKPTCGWCKKMENDLEARDIPYEYANLKEQAANDELHPRMQKAGLRISSYKLPVMDINGKLYIRPEIEIVAKAYQDI